MVVVYPSRTTARPLNGYRDPLACCVPLRTTKRPLGGYRDRGRAAVGFVERGEAGPCPEASAGRFLRLNTCPYWCFFRVVRLPHQVPVLLSSVGAAAAKNAVISAPRPSGRKRVLPVASSVNTGAAPKLPRTSAALLRHRRGGLQTYLQGFNRIARPPASRNCHHTPRRSLAEQGVWFSATSLRSRVRPIGRRPAAQNSRPTRDAPRRRPAQTLGTKPRSTSQAEGLSQSP